MTNEQHTTERRAWLALLLLVMGAAAASGGIYLTPAEVLQDGMMLVDHDGSTSPVRLPVIRFFQLMALAAAVALLALAAGVWWRRAYFAARAQAYVRDTRDWAAEIATELRDLASPENRWKLITLGLIVVVGTTVRFLGMDSPIRFDEAYTFNVHAATPFFNLISDYTTPNNHVFHSVLVRCSYLLFGDSPFALRLPALVAGILVIPATFWLIRRLLGDEPAILASALAAGSSALIGYSTNARGYTTLTLTLLIVFSLAVRLRDKRNLFAWTLFIVVLTLGFFTVPIMLYGACVVGVWLLLSAQGPRRWPMVMELTAAAASVAVLTCALYTPIAVRVGVEAIVANPFVRRLPMDVFVGGLGNLVTGIAQLWAYPDPLLFALLAGLAASLAVSGDAGTQSRRLQIALWVTVPTIIAAQRVLPYSRVFVMLFPLAYGLAAVGLIMLVRRGVGTGRWSQYQPAVVGVLALVLMCAPLTPRERDHSEFEDLSTIIAKLKPILRENDVIVAAVPLNEPLRYHARRAGLPSGTTQQMQETWTFVSGRRDTLFYMIEEKDPPRRQFVTFSLPTFRIDHPFLKEHYEEPEQVFETPATRVFRMRLKSE